MSCPPGTILNTKSYRCVSVDGRVGRGLVRMGEYAPAQAPAWREYFQKPRPHRQTVRMPRVGGGAFGDIIRMERAAVRGMAPPANIMAPTHMCPAGTVTNPHTGRCIKITGRTYKQLHHKPRVTAIPALAPAPVDRRALSEGPPAVPKGVSTVAPLADRNTTLQWMTGNCSNTTDPLTRTVFTAQPIVEDIVRLHDNTCVSAPGLHKYVEDFTALRAAMRRRDPSYKVPSRKHQPAQPTWQLYVSSDRRSGPEFASVMYVDVAKAQYTAYGIEYPPEAIRIDMGYIPATTPHGATCSAQTIVDLLDRLAKENRLLTPTAGGWRPVAGFPFRKDHWYTDVANRVNRLCRDLAKSLTQPL